MSPVVAADQLERSRAVRRRASALLAEGHAEAALRLLHDAVAQEPDDAALLIERGNVLQQLQRFAEAVNSYDRALDASPGRLAALVNRSNALRALNRLPEALHDVESALELRPDFPEALNNRGNLLRQLGRSEEALASFEQALALRGDFALALCNRGQLLLELRRPRAALASFETALRCVPGEREALYGRAAALLQLGERLEEAALLFAQAAAGGLDPGETLVGQAAALAGLQRHAQAAQCLEALLVIEPARAYARGSLLYSLLQSAQWTPLSWQIVELCEAVRAGSRVSYPHTLLAVCDLPEMQWICARTVIADQWPALPADTIGKHAGRVAQRPDSDTARASTAPPRIRLAYVSADFRDHPVPRLLIGTLERHDRQSFEVLGVALRPGPMQALGGRLRGAFDDYLDAADCNDEQIATLLRERAVDIAVDLTGFTEGLRPGIFAYRAAPVQVAYLGYPGTMGADYYDYVIADGIVVAKGEERWFAEQVVRLPHCYLPNDDRRPIGPVPRRADVGLPPAAFVFCAFTNAYKINPAVFDIWMRLLHAVPDGVLWLKDPQPDVRGRLLAEAAVRGIAGRLVFAPAMASPADHLARHALADLYLDTFPYSAHSTACDALWVGLPVLTCRGRGMAARAAASALNALQLPELITDSLAQYERRALELAQRPEQLAALRARLATSRLRSPLFDTSAYTRHLEAAYRRMHQRALAGQRPEAFIVTPSAESLS